jgi:hypothetical protein
LLFLIFLEPKDVGDKNAVVLNSLALMAVDGLGLIVWFVWLGTVMLRASQSSATKVPPCEVNGIPASKRMALSKLPGVTFYLRSKFDRRSPLRSSLSGPVVEIHRFTSWLQDHLCSMHLRERRRLVGRSFNRVSEAHSP